MSGGAADGAARALLSAYNRIPMALSMASGWDRERDVRCTTWYDHSSAHIAVPPRRVRRLDPKRRAKRARFGNQSYVNKKHAFSEALPC